MASGFGPRGPQARKTHVLAFRDHAGSPSAALTVFASERDNPLPRLYSYAIYFTHPDARPADHGAAGRLYETITRGPLYGSNAVEFRLDLYFLPRASRDDCMGHYRAEKSARGDFRAQIDAVAAASGGDAPPAEGKMPGLVPSYVYDKVAHRYHSLIYICDRADWQSGDRTMERVEFDPLSREDYEEFSKDPDDPREPDVLPETRVEIEAVSESESESSPAHGSTTGPVRSMGREMWDRAPREHMGKEAWEEARDRGWTCW